MINRAIVFVLIATGLAGALYIVLCLLLYAMQDDMIFARIKNDSMLARQWQERRVEIPGADGTIEGWWADNPNVNNNVTLVYFGGNAEDVLYTAGNADRFHARRMLVTNYRGYGGTAGRPSEAALFKDALSTYDYIVKHANVSPDDIVVVGRSLGSGIAVYVAANRRVRSAVLITPYDSMVAVAQRQYPYFPVQFLLKHKFASDQLAGKTVVPALFVAGQRDSVVPSIHAQRLFDKWAGPKSIRILEDVGHNDIERHDDYYPIINAFLDHATVR
jgi:fermentation-respiration switch protein FrsA (DUF1100 family)